MKKQLYTTHRVLKVILVDKTRKVKKVVPQAGDRKKK